MQNKNNGAANADQERPMGNQSQGNISQTGSITIQDSAFEIHTLNVNVVHDSSSSNAVGRRLSEVCDDSVDSVEQEQCKDEQIKGAVEKYVEQNVKRHLGKKRADPLFLAAGLASARVAEPLRSLLNTPRKRLIAVCHLPNAISKIFNDTRDDIDEIVEQTPIDLNYFDNADYVAGVISESTLRRCLHRAKDDIERQMAVRDVIDSCFPRTGQVDPEGQHGITGKISHGGLRFGPTEIVRRALSDLKRIVGKQISHNGPNETLWREEFDEVVYDPTLAHILERCSASTAADAMRIESVCVEVANVFVQKTYDKCLRAVLEVFADPKGEERFRGQIGAEQFATKRKKKKPKVSRQLIDE